MQPFHFIKLEHLYYFSMNRVGTFYQPGVDIKLQLSCDEKLIWTGSACSFSLAMGNWPTISTGQISRAYLWTRSFKTEAVSLICRRALSTLVNSLLC